GRADRTHAVGRGGPRSLQRERQRRRTRIRQDGPALEAATRGARARRARVGPGAGGGAGGRSAGDRIPVQRGGAPHPRTGPRRGRDVRGRRPRARFLKIRGARTILRAVTNALQIKSLVRGAWCVVASAALAACPHKSETLTPEPTAPLPTAGIAAQPVGVLP